jgi:transglutaminase-like putative cysteine protease
MLLSVIIPIASAEGAWWYPVIAIAAIGLGYSRTVRRNEPVLSVVQSRFLVVLAFVFLVSEYLWLSGIPVIALSHFLMLVCMFKLLQPRSLSDEVQLLILPLLLLVVAAIVSGSLLFLAVLILHLFIGVDGLIRLHFVIEAHRTEEANRLISGSAKRELLWQWPRRGVAAGLATSIGLASVVIGGLVFVFVPRVGSGMLGTLENTTPAHQLTGFSTTTRLDAIGPIRELRRPVMQVQIEYQGTIGQVPEEWLYFRGSSDRRYVQLGPPEGGWGWGRSESEMGVNTVRILPLDECNRYLQSFQEPGIPVEDELIKQTYWIEHGSTRYLFHLFPSISIESREFDEVQVRLADRTIKADQETGSIMRYSVVSVRPEPMNSARVGELMGAVRSADGLPGRSAAMAPLPDLPREADMRELLEERIGLPDDLEDPGEVLAFAERLERYLQSDTFEYSLEPGPRRSAREPIGEFLFRYRSGHCEYFASAMTVLCQLAGVPARVVHGYRGGDYNNVGLFYIVRERNAHAWVEVFLPGIGWVPRDPSPADTGAGDLGSRWLLNVYTYLDYLQFQWANLVISYDSETRHELFGRFWDWIRRPARDQRTIYGAVFSFVRELFGGRLQLSTTDRMLYWAFTLLVLTLISLITYVIVVVTARLIRWGYRQYQDWASSALRRGETGFYHHFCRNLDQLGFQRRPDQTPAEFAEELSAQSSVFRHAPMLVSCYYRVLYGGQQLDSAEIEAITRFLDTISQMDRSMIQPTT